LLLHALQRNPLVLPEHEPLRYCPEGHEEWSHDLLSMHVIHSTVISVMRKFSCRDGWKDVFCQLLKISCVGGVWVSVGGGRGKVVPTQTTESRPEEAHCFHNKNLAAGLTTRAYCRCRRMILFCIFPTRSCPCFDTLCSHTCEAKPSSRLRSHRCSGLHPAQSHSSCCTSSYNLSCRAGAGCP